MQRAFLPFLAALAGVSLIAGHLMAWWFGMPQPSLVPPFFILSLGAIGFGGAIGLVCYVIWLALWEREADPIPRVLATVRSHTSAQFLANRIAPVVFAFLFLSVFNTFKVFIPHINPFFLDGFLSDLDRWVFGTDPWRLTHAVIGPGGTQILDLLYGLWFPAWFFAVLHFSLFASKDLQRRFFLTFVASWALLGIGLAIAASSAGPCFLGLIHHPYAERYAALFPVENAPGATAAQAYLANAYLTGDLGLAKGISAMPSMHVAIVALLVVSVRSYGRLMFSAALFFYMVIFIASVHLGWHYVSDGVVATLAVVLLWRLTRSVGRAPESVLIGEARLQQT